jgi:MFS transporter, DHA1 family, tetracycline resistance protein
MAKATKHTLGLVAFIVFVDMLGVGLILPIMPSLIREIAEVRIDHAAKTGGFLLFAYAGMQFLFAPVIAGLSDRFGRRPVLLATLAALGVDYCLMAVAPTLGWLIVGRMISGIMGATWAAANSCVADSVAIERRGAAFGLLGGAGAAGFVLGPAIGGLAGELGTRVPFIIAATLALSGAVVGLFTLKETLSSERLRAFDIARANPLGSILQMAKTPFVLGCLATPLTSGLTVSLYGVLLAVAQAVLTGKRLAHFGVATTAKWSLCFGIPSCILLALAPSTPFVVLAIMIGCLTGMTFPALQSLMTERIDHNAQDELQGAIASTISLTSIIGPVMMTQIFGHFSDEEGIYFPSAPYIASIGLLVIAIGILWGTLARHGTVEPAGNLG